MIVAKKLKAQGVKPGVPDVLIFDSPPALPERRGVAIELKRRKGGRATGYQQDWLTALAERGWFTAVCRGAGEAIEELKQLGYGNQSFKQVVR